MRPQTMQAVALMTALAMVAGPEVAHVPAAKPKRPVEDDEERLAAAQAKRERKAAKRAAERKTP